jgi:hypothetical protein
MDQGLLKESSDGQPFWAYGGDFNEHVHDAMWLINGLVWPDRKWKPGCFQVKKTLSPVGISIRISKRAAFRYTARVSFRNGYQARTLSGMGWQWSLEIDGTPVSKSELRPFPPTPSAAAAEEATGGTRHAARDAEGFVVGGHDGAVTSDGYHEELVEMEVEAFTAVETSAHGCRAHGGGGGVCEDSTEKAERKSACGHEVVLTVSVKLMEDEVWAAAGYEIAFEQAVIPEFQCIRDRQGPGKVGDNDNKGRGCNSGGKGVGDGQELLSEVSVKGVGGVLRVEERQEILAVEGPMGLRVEWGMKNAELLLYSWDGVDVICTADAAARDGSAGGMLQSFWRAHTDNDNGGPDTLARFGATSQMYPTSAGFDKPTPRVRGAMAFGLWWMDLWGDCSYGRMWDKTGLAKLRAAAVNVQVAFRSEHRVDVRCSYNLVAPGTRTRLPCSTVYQVHSNGAIVAHNTVVVSPYLPPLPRIGMQLTLRPQFQHMCYFGRGPHEAYPDRCTGARLSRFETHVDDTYVPYIVPCENGMRCHVRWMALTDETGRGLLVSAGAEEETVHVSAHRFTSHDIHQATHTHEVRMHDSVTVTLDHAHMPCGGNDSWSRAHLENYLIAPGTYSYSLNLQPLSSRDAVARKPPPPSALSPATYSPPPCFSALLARTCKSAKAIMAATPIVLAERVVQLMSFKVPRVPAVLLLLAMIFLVCLAVAVWHFATVW